MVPLLVRERTTSAMQDLYGRDPAMLVWWATEIECVSALARLEREDALSNASLVDAVERLDALKGTWNEIQPTEAVRQTATRLLRVHPLRGADSLQLAAAFVAAEGRPQSLELLTLDGALVLAARREGFHVVQVREV